MLTSVHTVWPILYWSVAALASGRRLYWPLERDEDGRHGRADDGWGSGLLGVIIFSGSLPATRVAVAGFSPLFLTSARAIDRGAARALRFSCCCGRRGPRGGDIVSLAIVALGVVIGFPLLTALALQHITSAHSIVFIGLLPLATAIFGVLRGGERPKPAVLAVLVSRQRDGRRLRPVQRRIGVARPATS